MSVTKEDKIISVGELPKKIQNYADQNLSKVEQYEDLINAKEHNIKISEKDIFSLPSELNLLYRDCIIDIGFTLDALSNGDNGKQVYVEVYAKVSPSKDNKHYEELIDKNEIDCVCEKLDIGLPRAVDYLLNIDKEKPRIGHYPGVIWKAGILRENDKETDYKKLRHLLDYAGQYAITLSNAIMDYEVK